MNKEETKLFSIFTSPCEDERMAWEEVYGANIEEYEMWPDYEECSSSFESRKSIRVDLDNVEFPDSFVSFDFENLFPQRVTACSVGMVKYKNGKIDDTFYTLIRPPFEYEGKRGPALTFIHGFTENDFEGQPTFAEVLPLMEAFIEGLPLVAHNACVERACIHDACAYYNIETSIPYENIIDTYLLSKAVDAKLGFKEKIKGYYSLSVVCQRYGVPVLRHHHACDDAEMCGNLFLALPKYLSGELALDESVLRQSIEYCEKELFSGNSIYSSYAQRGHTILSGDILQKDLSCADPDNPFYDRKVVITGVFNIARQELAQKLKSMGADIDTNVSSKTNYLLIGDDPGPSKLRKFDELIAEGKDVRKIFQEDLDKILAGECYENYYTEAPVSKPRVLKQEGRKTTWPKLVEKFKLYIEGEEIEFTERETKSEDYRLLTLYYKQQQKIPVTKSTVIDNLRQLDGASENEFRKDILACFTEGENISKEIAYERMQGVFTKYGLFFKAKTCVLNEFDVAFEEYKVKGIHHLTIKHIPQP